MKPTKRCRDCGKTKPLTEFDKNKRNTTDGRVGHCKICRKARQANARKSKNPTAEQKALEDFYEKIARGKELEQVNRIRKMPRDGKNLLMVLKKIDKIMDAYQKRCTLYSPSFVKKIKGMKKTTKLVRK